MCCLLVGLTAKQCFVRLTAADDFELKKSVASSQAPVQKLQSFILNVLWSASDCWRRLLVRPILICLLLRC